MATLHFQLLKASLTQKSRDQQLSTPDEISPEKFISGFLSDLKNATETIAQTDWKMSVKLGQSINTNFDEILEMLAKFDSISVGTLSKIVLKMTYFNESNPEFNIKKVTNELQELVYIGLHNLRIFKTILSAIETDVTQYFVQLHKYGNLVCIGMAHALVSQYYNLYARGAARSAEEKAAVKFAAFLSDTKLQYMNFKQEFAEKAFYEKFRASKHEAISFYAKQLSFFTNNQIEDWFISSLDWFSGVKSMSNEFQEVFIDAYLETSSELCSLVYTNLKPYDTLEAVDEQRENIKTLGKEHGIDIDELVNEQLRRRSHGVKNASNWELKQRVASMLVEMAHFNDVDMDEFGKLFKELFGNDAIKMFNYDVSVDLFLHKTKVSDAGVAPVAGNIYDIYFQDDQIDHQEMDRDSTKIYEFEEQKMKIAKVYFFLKSGEQDDGDLNYMLGLYEELKDDSEEKAKLLAKIIENDLTPPPDYVDFVKKYRLIVSTLELLKKHQTNEIQLENGKKLLKYYQQFLNQSDLDIILKQGRITTRINRQLLAAAVGLVPLRIKIQYVKNQISNFTIYYRSILAVVLLMAFFFTFYDMFQIDYAEAFDAAREQMVNVTESVIEYVAQLEERGAMALSDSLGTLPSIFSEKPISTSLGLLLRKVNETAPPEMGWIDRFGKAGFDVGKAFATVIIGTGKFAYTWSFGPLAEIGQKALDMINLIGNSWQDFSTGYGQTYSMFAETAFFKLWNNSPWVVVGAIAGRLPRLQLYTAAGTVAAKTLFTLVRLVRTRELEKALLITRFRDDEKQLSFIRMFYRKKVSKFFSSQFKIAKYSTLYTGIIGLGPTIIIPAIITTSLALKHLLPTLDRVTSINNMFSTDTTDQKSIPTTSSIPNDRFLGLLLANQTNAAKKEPVQEKTQADEEEEDEEATRLYEQRLKEEQALLAFRRKKDQPKRIKPAKPASASTSKKSRRTRRTARATSPKDSPNYTGVDQRFQV